MINPHFGSTGSFVTPNEFSAREVLCAVLRVQSGNQGVHQCNRSPRVAY
jgi:hypothetical protein